MVTAIRIPPASFDAQWPFKIKIRPGAERDAWFWINKRAARDNCLDGHSWITNSQVGFKDPKLAAEFKLIWS